MNQCGCGDCFKKIMSFIIITMLNSMWMIDSHIFAERYGNWKWKEKNDGLSDRWGRDERDFGDK